MAPPQQAHRTEATEATTIWSLWSPWTPREKIDAGLRAALIG